MVLTLASKVQVLILASSSINNFLASALNRRPDNCSWSKVKSYNNKLITIYVQFIMNEHLNKSNEGLVYYQYVRLKALASGPSALALPWFWGLRVEDLALPWTWGLMTWPCLGLEGWYDTYLIEDLALLWSWGLRTWPSLGFEGWELGLALDLRVEDLALPWSWGLRTWPWLRHLRWWWGGWWLIDWLVGWLVDWWRCWPKQRRVLTPWTWSQAY